MYMHVNVYVHMCVYGIYVNVCVCVCIFVSLHGLFECFLFFSSCDVFTGKHIEFLYNEMCSLNKNCLTVSQ